MRVVDDSWFLRFNNRVGWIVSTVLAGATVGTSLVMRWLLCSVNFEVKFPSPWFHICLFSFAGKEGIDWSLDMGVGGREGKGMWRLKVLINPCCYQLDQDYYPGRRKRGKNYKGLV
ncbi:unnamed protein product [Linum tenue]|uniref:Uncharacterized protein n=1 Tax=Linum tenue TaxID=586396 RepID=A0AAV0H7U1_9ROSI|nr:unnamed protein product [Linum tenue]